jgi:tRNA modification GTPase
VSDTAGIREPQGSIEREGIRRTLAHARDADLVVWLSDASVPDATPAPPELAARGDKLFLAAANKIEIPGARSLPGALAVSAKTGAGIDALTARIGDIARDRVGTSGSPAITRARYREHLHTCMSALHTYMSGVPTDMELRAEDLRQAAHALGRITGRVDVEDVLGEIFGRFCIGK